MDRLRRERAQAAETREGAHAAVTGVQARVARYRALTDANLARASETPAAALEDVLRARAELPQAEQQLAELTLAAHHADRQYAEARQALLDAQEDEYRTALPPLLRAAASDLRRAQRSMQAVADLQERHHAATSRPVDLLALWLLLDPAGHGGDRVAGAHARAGLPRRRRVETLRRRRAHAVRAGQVPQSTIPGSNAPRERGLSNAERRRRLTAFANPRTCHGRMRTGALFFRRKRVTEDQILMCVECRCEFVFSPGEQTFYAERGFTPPKRCRACRKARREREDERSVHAFDR